MRKEGAGKKALVVVAVDKKGAEALKTLVEGLEHEMLRLQHAPGTLIMLNWPVASSAHRSRCCESWGRPPLRDSSMCSWS
jgi:hypothetical protein